MHRYNNGHISPVGFSQPNDEQSLCKESADDSMVVDRETVFYIQK